MNRPYSAIYFIAIALSACASNPDRAPLGNDRQQTIAATGAPTTVYPLGQGERLQYSRQPSGRQVYNLDFDAQGKLVSARQVLTEPDFARVQTGSWQAADIERAFGKPAFIARVASFDGPVWTYRYDYFGTPKLFHVLVDEQGVVSRTQMTEEPVGNDHRREP